jgi:hypothetical protein
VYVVDSEVQRMEITNFNPATDVLSIGSSTGAASLATVVTDTHVTSTGLEIDFSSGAVVVLDGITSASALTASDVSFFGGAYTPPPAAAPTSTLASLAGTSPSFIIGAWGNNQLHGTGATEVFFAPGGNEVLTGGGTRDIFIVDSEIQRMEITNFNPATDVLYIGSSAGVTSLQTLAGDVHTTKAGLEIDLPGGAVVVLDGLSSPAALTSTNTAFFQGAYTPPSTTASTSTSTSTTPVTTAHAPVVIAEPVTLSAGLSVAVANLISVSDPNGVAITDYYLYDPSKAISLNGATNLVGPANQAKGYFEVSGGDLAKLTYLAGAPGIVDLQIMAEDGVAQSTWVQETITIVGVATPSAHAAHGAVAS